MRGRQETRNWKNYAKEFEWLYHDQNWSQEKIAKRFGVSQTGIGKILKRLEIPSRTRARAGKLNGRYVDGSQATLYRILIAQTIW
jgi:transcriptional regulator with XRE-family HTH domain